MYEWTVQRTTVLCERLQLSRSKAQYAFTLRSRRPFFLVSKTECQNVNDPLNANQIFVRNGTHTWRQQGHTGRIANHIVQH